jgi:aldose 1-epimerase
MFPARVWRSLFGGLLGWNLCGCSTRADAALDPKLPKNADPVEAAAAEAIPAEPFGDLAGTPVSIYTLTNHHGLRARVTNYGGSVVSLEVPDRNGKLADVVLGYDTLAEYVASKAYFGALVGRYANRIALGAFTLARDRHQLSITHPPHTLHGGNAGFDKKVWAAQGYRSRAGSHLTLHYVSPDGEEGFPGELDATVTYTLSENDSLIIDYFATASAPTVVNLTHHGYFNLAGAGHGSVLEQRLQINAAEFTPVSSTSIPTGELRPVAGTPFDFTSPTPIGLHIADPDEQLRFGKGYDHNFVLRPHAPDRLGFAARVTDPVSGRTLDVFTTEPGLQLYTGNHLSGTGKGGLPYAARSAFALEAEHFPDSPNQPAFPSTRLLPGERYTQRTLYHFGTDQLASADPPANPETSSDPQ